MNCPGLTFLSSNTTTKGISVILAAGPAQPWYHLLILAGAAELRTSKGAAPSRSPGSRDPRHRRDCCCPRHGVACRVSKNVSSEVPWPHFSVTSGFKLAVQPQKQPGVRWFCIGSSAVSAPPGRSRSPWKTRGTLYPPSSAATPWGCFPRCAAQASLTSARPFLVPPGCSLVALSL